MTYREGAVVKDAATGLVGVVVRADHDTDQARLRRLGSEFEWEAPGRALRLATAEDRARAIREVAP
ncbi:hypothetical protein [Streptomyces sp. NPDC003077]|uniref:hypothetical protein n=1 Tax=Streptomyces sp. NPDC003077 TaxID=3154443 RepID=UPI0033A2F735